MGLPVHSSRRTHDVREGVSVIDPSWFPLRMMGHSGSFLGDYIYTNCNRNIAKTGGPGPPYVMWKAMLPILNTFAPVPPARLAILSALAKLAVDDPETFDVVIGDHVEHLGLAK